VRRYPAAVRFLGVCVLACAVAATASAAPMPNPCSLVSDAKLRSAIGAKIAHKEPHLANGARMCQWQPASYSDEFKQVTLTVQPLDRAKFTAKWNRPIKGVRPVRGVGEMAYSINGGIWLVAWRNGIEITVNTTELRQPLATATLVAKLAFAHI
jgi:hypothetical protein